MFAQNILKIGGVCVYSKKHNNYTCDIHNTKGMITISACVKLEMIAKDKKNTPIDFKHKLMAIIGKASFKFFPLQHH
jgi:hypothetical protein